MDGVISGRTVVAGSGKGPLLVCHEPLSFWGGYDAETGVIIDRRHPLAGQCARATVFALPATRGSSTTTAILLEAIRSGAAPVAFVTEGTDSFLALALVVAREMYESHVPLVALASADFARLRSGRRVRVDERGTIESVE